mgnify:CR=1 FL=1
MRPGWLSGCGRWQDTEAGDVTVDDRLRAPLLADGQVADGDAPHAEEFFDEADTETVAVIKDLLETRIRPAVASDGGDITFKGFKDGTVYLHMQGACSGCPSSTATLKSGIENLLRHFVPGVEAVAQV